MHLLLTPRYVFYVPRVVIMALLPTPSCVFIVPKGTFYIPIWVDVSHIIEYSIDIDVHWCRKNHNTSK
jgi:hypothetical protein